MRVGRYEQLVDQVLEAEMRYALHVRDSVDA
jgi:hypothetical protein